MCPQSACMGRCIVRMVVFMWLYKSRRAHISGHLGKIAPMTPGCLWFFPDSKIMLWTCPKWKKNDNITKFLFCPHFARSFTKMSPDEELVTLKFYVCRHCNYWHIFLGIWWSVYGRSVFCHLVCMFRKIGLYFQICLGMDLEKNKLAKLREGLRRASRRCHDLSTENTHFWKWSEWVAKCLRFFVSVIGSAVSEI